MKNKLILATILSSLCISPAMAMDDAMMEQKNRWMFDQIDTNKDASISQAEHTSFGTGMFAEADKNHDNMISYDELLAEKELERSRMDKAMGKTAISHDNPKLEEKARWYLNQIDKNHDGNIDPMEHAAFGTAMWTEADANRDNALSYAEFSAQKKMEKSRFEESKKGETVKPGEHLPNRVNANPSDRSINKGAPEGIQNNKYLSK